MYLAWPRLRRSVLSIVFFAFCLRAQASVPLSLPEAIRQALAANPELLMRQADEQAARGQVVQAGLKPNPRMTLQSEDLRRGSQNSPFNFANFTEDYFLIGQAFEMPGKRSGRVKVAGGNLRAAEYGQDTSRRQVIARVTSAYWTAAAAARALELTQQSVATYNEDISYLENRVREGVTAEGDLIRLKIERARVQATAVSASRDSNQARVALFRAMGKSDFPDVALTTGLDELTAPEIPAVDRVLALRPEVASAQAAVRQAEDNIGLQRAYSRPDPEVVVGYKRNAGFNTAYASVQIDLPVRNRNQGNISAAESQLHAAQAQLQMTTNAVRAEYESAVRAYIDDRRVIEPIRSTIPDAQDSERRARAAYREGALDILRLLDAERSRIQVELDYARALTDLQQAANTVEQVTGEPFRGESSR